MPKTVAVDDEVYDELVKIGGKNETFSEIIKKVLKERRRIK
jgi:predicted CopG family antitoxin